MAWAEVKMAVKSIQRGYAAVTNADVTITLPKAVDPTRCLVLLDGFCGMYLYSTQADSGNAYVYAAGGYSNSDGKYLQMVGISTQDSYTFRSGGHTLSGSKLQTPVGYAAARKPYVKALTETQLTIGQSGTYSNGSNGTTVSYQVIEFFN